MRNVLSPRRPAETFTLRFWNQDFSVTIGRYPDGQAAEVFIDGGKAGQAAQAIARDAAVTLSLALQHGVPLMTIRRAITRGAHGEADSILGAIVDRLAADAAGTRAGPNERGVPMTGKSIGKALAGRKAGSGLTARGPAHDDRTPILSIPDAEENTYALRGVVFTVDAPGGNSGFIVVHEDEHGDMSAVPGHYYENQHDAEAAAELEAERIGARYVGVTE